MWAAHLQLDENHCLTEAIFSCPPFFFPFSFNILSSFQRITSWQPASAPLCSGLKFKSALELLSWIAELMTSNMTCYFEGERGKSPRWCIPSKPCSYGSAPLLSKLNGYNILALKKVPHYCKLKIIPSLYLYYWEMLKNFPIADLVGS